MTKTHTRVDPDAVAALVQRARREIDEGLLPACQVALAKDGELVAFEALGMPPRRPASSSSRARRRSWPVRCGS